MIGMDGPELDDDRAMERILHSERASFRVIAYAKVKAVADGRADVELLARDVYLGPENKPEPQDVKLTGLPILGLGSGPLMVFLPVAVGAEVMIVCADRSVAPFSRESTAQPAQVRDMSLHGFNGAGILPIEISMARWPADAPTDRAIIGMKDGSTQLQVSTTGEIVAKAATVKLGSASASSPVANADTADSNDDLIRTHSNSVGTILGIPPLPPTPSCALSKVKGE